MDRLLLVGQWATSASLGVLALITLAQWVRQRDRRTLYLALGVGLLGAVSLVSALEALQGPKAFLASSRLATFILGGALLVAFLLSGYALLLLGQPSFHSGVRSPLRTL